MNFECNFKWHLIRGRGQRRRLTLCGPILTVLYVRCVLYWINLVMKVEVDNNVEIGIVT